jgi:hypothetical protein
VRNHYQQQGPENQFFCPVEDPASISIGYYIVKFGEVLILPPVGSGTILSISLGAVNHLQSPSKPSFDFLISSEKNKKGEVIV